MTPTLLTVCVLAVVLWIAMSGPSDPNGFA
jgi:hypothetical protein